MTNGTQNGQTETIVASNGEAIPVSRADMRRQIARLATDRQISNDEAWEEIKSNLQQFIETGKIAKDFGGNPSGRKKSGPQQEFFEDTSSVPELTLTGLPVAGQGGARVAELTSSVPTSDLGFSDDLLPEHLRNKGITLMDAITKGLIKVPGEHPDAELLRASVAESGGLFSGNQSIEDKPSLKAIRDRQMAFPFKIPTNVRIMPTDFNQTSLFHVASNNTPRRQYKNELMGKIGDSVNIFFHGEELRHDDEANFLQLIHLARGKAPYEWIHAETVPFIRGSRGSSRILSVKDGNSVEESLMRMRGAFVVVRNTKRRGGYITVNLIRDLQGSGSQRRIMIDPCMVALLDSYTAMDQGVLYDLKGVARQLFKYISTKPYVGLYPTKVISFFELCYGTLDSIKKHYRLRNPEKTDAQVNVAMVKKISDFRRQALPTALQELKERELIIDYTVDHKEDKVAIVKNGATVEHVTYQTSEPRSAE